MSDFEPFDDELAAELRRRASGGGAGSTAAAHDAVLHRAGAIRRRRAAIGGAGAMAVLLIGGIALLPRGAEEVGPAVTGDVLPTFDDDATTVRPPDTSGQAVGTTDRDAPPTSEQSVPAGAPDSTAATLPATSIPTSVVVTPSSSVPRAAASSSVAAGSTATAPPSTSTPGTTVTSAPVATSLPGLAPFTDTYRSLGGSITVTWSGSAFVLQAVSPEVGFVAEVEDATATRVRVRFEGVDADSRIEVRVADGRLDVDID